MLNLCTSQTRRPGGLIGSSLRTGHMEPPHMEAKNLCKRRSFISSSCYQSWKSSKIVYDDESRLQWHTFQRNDLYDTSSIEQSERQQKHKCSIEEIEHFQRPNQVFLSFALYTRDSYADEWPLVLFTDINGDWDWKDKQTERRCRVGFLDRFWFGIWQCLFP